VIFCLRFELEMVSTASLNVFDQAGCLPLLFVAALPVRIQVPMPFFPLFFLPPRCFVSDLSRCLYFGNMRPIPWFQSTAGGPFLVFHPSFFPSPSRKAGPPPFSGPLPFLGTFLIAYRITTFQTDSFLQKEDFFFSLFHPQTPPPFFCTFLRSEAALFPLLFNSWPPPEIRLRSSEITGSLQEFFCMF